MILMHLMLMGLKRIQQRKEKRKKIIIGVVVAALMVLSMLGILGGSNNNPDSVEDYGVKFSRKFDGRMNYFMAKINGVEKIYYDLPSQLVGMANGTQTYGVRNAEVVIITINPDSDPVNLQLMDLIKFDLENVIDKPIIKAVTNVSAQYNLPVITCDNATTGQVVIQLDETKYENFVFENNCLMASGNKTGLRRVRDRIIYDYYGLYDG
jgi:uncharacterized membrane protein